MSPVATTLKAAARPDAAEVLMHHAHRIYELDALLDVLEDATAQLQQTAEQARRSNALSILAARIAREAVGVVDALVEAEITWRGGAR